MVLDSQADFLILELETTCEEGEWPEIRDR